MRHVSPNYDTRFDVHCTWICFRWTIGILVFTVIRFNKLTQTPATPIPSPTYLSNHVISHSCSAVLPKM